eukprot:592599-Hanusia_phi.AAC.1
MADHRIPGRRIIPDPGPAGPGDQGPAAVPDPIPGVPCQTRLGVRYRPRRRRSCGEPPRQRNFQVSSPQLSVRYPTQAVIVGYHGWRPEIQYRRILY